MATDYRRVADYFQQIVSNRKPAEIARLQPHHGPAGPRVPGGASTATEAIERRWQIPGLPAAAREALFDDRAAREAPLYERNIEHFIGTVRLPVGLIGPLRVNGLFANGDYYVPLATTEAALVASYSRGARVLLEAGGCTTLTVNEGVSRAPGFAFDTTVDAALFVAWATTAIEAFRAAAATTTRHGRLIDMQVTLEGNHVYLGFEFSTGDAAGQNMATIATDAICRYIQEHAPTRPRYAFVEANLSGDKKATSHSFMSVRGRKVTAEVRLPPAIVHERLHTTTATLLDYWRMSALGGVMSGSIGVQGHYANGLAALFIACGQDAACVAEAAVGVTRFEPIDDGGLYAAVTLPSLIVGSVGGGTGLPTQRACLEIMGLAGAGHARALGEVAAAVALAGELSITGALAAGHFTDAHQRLARGSRPSDLTPNPPA
jgi:hydroxymethylglutaryl-CoA reductase (NADPH)